MQSFLQKIKAPLLKLRNHKIMGKINVALLMFFPLFVVLVAELNQMHSIRRLLSFVWQRPEVIVLDTLMVGIFFAVLLFFFKYAYVAAAIVGLPLYIISCVEYFKFRSSGSHFVLGDIFMAGNASDLSKFADIRISFYLVFNLLAVTAYVLVLLFTGAKIAWRLKNRLIAGTAVTAVTAFVFFSPDISFTILNSFAVDTEPSLNVYEANENFSEDNMLAYLMQDTAVRISNAVKEPADYSEETVDKVLEQLPAEREDSISFESPDIIFVLSESFGDYRKLLGDTSGLDSYYTNFDAIGKEGVLGNCVVPTFGGYTTRSEFELLMGLPVKSLNNSELPHRLLEDRDQASITSYYNGLGYDTTYIHPFTSSFYDRDGIYAEYGFDRMLFKDDLTVNAEYFRNYISDRTVFKQVEQLLSDSDQPHYIFATTMQNHQPYSYPETGLTEFEYYMQGIGETDKALGDFVEFLKEYDRPVILVFMGDHYPFLNEDGNPYEQAGITAGNVESLYQKEYLLWSNRELDASLVPDNISLFYVPYLVRQLTGSPQTEATRLMEEQMRLCPIYSYNVAESPEDNELLDLFTYDAVKGELYFKHSVSD